MTIALTSLEAYKEAVINGTVKTQRDKIFKWLVANTSKGKSFTRNEIAEYNDMRLSAVCGRINQLVHDGFVSDSVDERPDRFTGVRSKTVAVVVGKTLPLAPQLRLSL